MMSGPQSFGFVSGQKNFTTNKTGGAFKTPPVVSPAFYGQANLVPLRHDNLVALSAYRYYVHGFTRRGSISFSVSEASPQTF